jgi:hypothetical protein
MLRSDEVQTILTEVMSGKQPSITTPEALEFRKNLEDECAEMEAEGLVVDMPHEIPLADEEPRL